MDEQLARWRLILGKASEGSLGGLSGRARQQEVALDWLYQRGSGDDGRAGSAAGPRQGGEGDSQLTTPDWINEVHRLFPKETIERLERDAVETYGLVELVTNPEVLERAEPNPTLLRAVLQTRHLMDARVLAAARRLVQKVIEQLLEALCQVVESAFRGALQRHRSSRFSQGPLDLRRTIAGNLGRWDPSRRKLLVERTWHHERRERRLDSWQILLVVDQSGSMLDSTIHAAVMASILHRLPGIHSHLICFDTQIIDLTDDVRDPVKTLMSVQLGGGTDIGKAMQYAASQVHSPHQAIVVLITDFYEGGSPAQLESVVAGLTAHGTQVLGLAALDREAVPVYDREQAARLVALGAEVGAMTPGELATWLAEKVRR